MALAIGIQVYLALELLCVCRLAFELDRVYWLRKFASDAKLAKRKLQCPLMC